MTPQEIFNKVAKHLLAQGEPSKDYYSRCAYRGRNKTMCAVGCLIPDELYEKRFEGTSASQVLIWLKDKPGSEAAGLTLDNELLLLDLQLMHDQYDPRAWPNRLQSIAATHSLEMPQ